MTIARIDEVTEYPLCWPDSKPRAAKRMEGNPYSWNATLAAAREQVDAEMRRSGVRSYVISMSPRHRYGSPDPGAAVWWNAKAKNGGAAELRVIACDTYDKAEVNLYAIGLTLNRIRLIERYGAYTLEQAMEGARPALPPPAGASEIDWRKVLGDVPPGVTGDDALAIVNARYRRQAAEAGTDENELRRLNLAVEKARAEMKA